MLFWQGCRPVPESAGAFFVQGLSWDRNDRFDESVSLLRVAPIRAVLAARRGRAPAGVRDPHASREPRTMSEVGSAIFA